MVGRGLIDRKWQIRRRFKVNTDLPGKTGNGIVEFDSSIIHICNWEIVIMALVFLVRSVS